MPAETTVVVSGDYANVGLFCEPDFTATALRHLTYSVLVDYSAQMALSLGIDPAALLADTDRQLQMPDSTFNATVEIAGQQHSCRLWVEPLHPGTALLDVMDQLTSIDFPAIAKQMEDPT